MDVSLEAIWRNGYPWMTRGIDIPEREKSNSFGDNAPDSRS
jgi:hypothetical protein